MNELTNSTNAIAPVPNLNGAGERAKQWLLNLLTALYQQYGATMWDSPQVAGLLGLLQMPLPGLAPIRLAVLTFKESGPAALGDRLVISDADAAAMLNLFYMAVVDGFKTVLDIDLEAE